MQYNIQLLKILREVGEKFSRYKMPKTLSGDVAVKTATLLSSPVSSVGSFLKVPIWLGHLQKRSC